MGILKKTFCDFFTARMMFFAIAPLILCGIFWYGILWYGVSLILHADINTLSENIGNSFFSFLAHTWVITILQWIIIGIMVVGGSFSLIYVSVILALFIISFLTPAIVSFVNKRHYNHQKTTGVSFFKTFFIMFFDSVKFLCFLLFSLVFFAVPYIGFLVGSIGVFLSFFYIYYRFMIVDVRSCVLDKDGFFMPIKHEFSYKISIFAFYILSHIPFVGFFCQIAFIIYLTHLVYEKELGYGLSK